MPILFNDFKKQYQLRKTKTDAAIARVLDSGWYILWNECESFENTFAAKNNSQFCIGVGNGLDAIKIGLLALGIGNGDEVITTSHSAVATTLAILEVWAKPVFVDIDRFYHIDVAKIEASITENTKAILPVHLYGQPCDMKSLLEICKNYWLRLIEDCAQSHFSSQDGTKVGNFWDVACYSFYPTKNLWAYGDAGAIVTNDESIAKSCRMIRNYGQENRYVHKTYGINSRLDEIQAAILSVQLEHIDSDTDRRREIAAIYRSHLSNIPGVTIANERPDSIHTYHLFVIETEQREKLVEYLTANGVPNLIHYPLPIHRQPFLADEYGSLELPILEAKIQTILSIPVHPLLEEKDQIHIINTIRSFYGA